MDQEERERTPHTNPPPNKEKGKKKEGKIWESSDTNHTSMEFQQMYFSNVVYHLYQTCMLKHRSQQALQRHWYLVVCFQPAAKKI